MDGDSGSPVTLAPSFLTAFIQLATLGSSATIFLGLSLLD